MSLYGVMRTSTSGMNAQSNRLSTVAENVANSNTTGYKAARAEFSSLFTETSVNSYNSGAVDTNVRRMVGTQGNLTPTTSRTDLGIKGDGFFIVSNTSNEKFLTRAGAFVPDASGQLVNGGGFTLMGYPLAPNTPTVTVNGFNGLVPVRLGELSLSATASTDGVFQANLPSEATSVAAANLPSANVAASEYTAKSSLVAYGNLGEQQLLDIYFAKSGTGTWDISVFDRAAAGPAGGFPYSAPALASNTLSFDPTTGKLSGTSANSLAIPVPGGATLDLDLSNMLQLASPYSVQTASVNGNGAGAADLVEIGSDGTVFAAFGGIKQAVYRIPLANVESPDNLDAQSGNVFLPTLNSGAVQIGFSGEAGFGEINSGVLEQSTVDVASEFTDMIDAQRSYTANSKVFQTGAELMDVLVNLKR